MNLRAMSELFEFLNTALVVIFGILMIFLFKGEPSLFDKLHERAMQAASKVECAK